jgi:hypothetical protein
MIVENIAVVRKRGDSPLCPRGGPARLKPGGLLLTEDEPVDLSVTYDERIPPAGVPASQVRLSRLAVEREDPLLAVDVLEVPIERGCRRDRAPRALPAVRCRSP